MKKFSHKILGLLLLLAGPCAQAQTVTNVDYYQNGKQIVVTYSLDKKADITVYYSINGGRSYSDRLQYVIGDVGPSITPGTDKCLTWDVLSEVTEFSGDNIVFKVEAKDRNPPKVKKEVKPGFFVTMQFAIPGKMNLGDASGSSLSSNMSMGVMIGRVKHFGWYAQGLFSLNSSGSSDDSMASFDTATAGALVHLGHGFHLFGGVGYAWRSAGYQGLDNGYDGNFDTSYSSFAVDAGLLYRHGLLVVTAGTVLTFKYQTDVVANLGIGLCF